MLNTVCTSMMIWNQHKSQHPKTAVSGSFDQSGFWPNSRNIGFEICVDFKSASPGIDI